MPCIQAQYGTPAPSPGPRDHLAGDLLTPELSKPTMDLASPEAAPAVPTALPSFSTFMDGYTGEFDTFLYQLPGTAQPCSSASSSASSSVTPCAPQVSLLHVLIVSHLPSLCFLQVRGLPGVRLLPWHAEWPPGRDPVLQRL